jgi:hypothetical protein
VKRVFLFGALVLPKEAGCHDVCDIFAKMAESRSSTAPRIYMTAAQRRLLRIKAHEVGRPSIALKQAIFELGMRQADVIGEWIPIGWPDLSDITHGTKKWMMGLRWNEIGDDLVLKHRLSKSIHGARNLTDPTAGTVKARDLASHPIVASSRLIRKEFAAKLARVYRKPVFWSRSYCIISCGGAPLSILKQYIEHQEPPE